MNMSLNIVVPIFLSAGSAAIYQGWTLGPSYCNSTQPFHSGYPTTGYKEKLIKQQNINQCLHVNLAPTTYQW